MDFDRGIVVCFFKTTIVGATIGRQPEMQLSQHGKIVEGGIPDAPHNECLNVGLPHSIHSVY